MTIYDAEVIFDASIAITDADGSAPIIVTIASGKLMALSRLEAVSFASVDLTIALIDQDNNNGICVNVPAPAVLGTSEPVDLLSLLTTVQEPYLWLRPDKFLQIAVMGGLLTAETLTIRGCYYQFAALPGLPV